MFLTPLPEYKGLMKIKYRGSYPAPKREHGEMIPGHGIIRARNRRHSGWEYVCYSKDGISLFVYEPDSKPTTPAAMIETVKEHLYEHRHDNN